MLCVWVLASLVKNYEQWKKPSYLFVWFGESPFLQTAHAIPLGLFRPPPLFTHDFSLTFFFSGSHSHQGRHTSTPSSLALLFFSLICRLNRHQAHPTYRITVPLLSVSLPAELSISGSDVARSERGQTQSEHRTAVILSASVCSRPHSQLKRTCANKNLTNWGGVYHNFSIPLINDARTRSDTIAKSC